MSSEVVAVIQYLKARARFSVKDALAVIGLPRATYFRWLKTNGKLAKKAAVVPKSHWLLPWEKEAIIAYKKQHPDMGYRRLAFKMLDENIVAVTPSSVYRVLKEAGLSNKWTPPGGASKKGFDQPGRPHEQWHTDISYLNILGTNYFFLAILDGYSRAIMHHEIRTDMSTLDVEVVLERALRKLPDSASPPRLITDNGGQYVSREFKQYLRENRISHSRARPRHPQSNGKLERFHRSLKEECIRRNGMGTLDEARAIVARYVEEYNTRRPHASLNYLTPADYLQGPKQISRRLAERRHKLNKAKIQRKQSWRQAA